jgi:kynureninase
MQFEFTQDFAKNLDTQDVLKNFRNEFIFPLSDKNEELVYLCGNSLGLQPKRVREYVNQELDDWAKYGVEGHFHAKRPWFSYHEALSSMLAKLTGGKTTEVVCMNQLTVNLHLLMASFYQPKGNRNKIICEAKAFPSDRYALVSQIKFHGLNPDDVLIEIAPNEGEYLIDDSKFIEAIEKNKDQLALVMIGGVNYFTGQVFDLESISKSCKAAGAMMGVDLAHAIGNVELKLHDWNIDFATWCSYKYLNSSPGGVSGVFVHEKHHTNKDIKRFEGWWGHSKERRFLMEPDFIPIESAEAWQLSNAPILTMAAHLASLTVFEEAGLENIFNKRKLLSDYLFFVVDKINEELKNNHINNHLSIITPKEENRRGAQVSIVVAKEGRKLFETISKNGIIADWREPNVIRIAPAPLYNSFADVYKFAQLMLDSLKS